ncbi:MAG: acetoacetate decarboxylase family protein [Betaproteobacteria bacterium]
MAKAFDSSMENPGSDAIADAFSQPFGRGMLYPRPPYSYRDAQMGLLLFRADAAAVRRNLPPGVTLIDKTPLCLVNFASYAHTAFGPYQEVYVAVQVQFRGETYMYSPMMFSDNEGATAAGRELWGFAKKRAAMRFERAGEQICFTAERPAGHPVISCSVTAERLATPAEFAAIAFPTLTMRIIPNHDAGSRPSVCQLLATRNQKRYHQSAFGTDELWSGRPALRIDSHSEVDPWHDFQPVELIGGWFSHSDLELPAATLVHDYLAP